MPSPDPKSPPRIKDPDALARARLMFDECAACARPPANGHHVLPRGAPWHGDDVVANIALLCGSGTMGCHGAVHGSPYTDHAGKKWSHDETCAAIGRYLLAKRPDTIEYVLTKLGWGRGREALRRLYFIDLPDDYANAA